MKKFKKIKRDKAKFALQMKVLLKDSHPPIWRRFLVPDNYTFFDLHVAIQDAMGWFDCHLHAFSYEKNRFDTRLVIQLPNPEDDEYFESGRAIDESKTKVTEFLKKEKDHVTYEYDFGDGWTHRVELEKIFPFQTKEKYPQMVAGKGMCPWEDSGGTWGFYDKIETLKGRDGGERREIIEWLIDIGEIDEENIGEQIAEIDLKKFDQRRSLLE